jgi:hypothetical protein
MFKYEKLPNLKMSRQKIVQNLKNIWKIVQTRKGSNLKNVHIKNCSKVKLFKAKTCSS